MFSAETGWSFCGNLSLKDLDSAFEKEKRDNLKNSKKREPMERTRNAIPAKTLIKKPIPVKPNKMEETKNQLTIGVELIGVGLIAFGSIAEGVMGVGSIGVGLTLADPTSDEGLEGR